MQTRLFTGGEFTDAADGTTLATIDEPKATWINIDAQLPAYYPR
jgi:hypothetical protein